MIRTTLITLVASLGLVLAIAVADTGSAGARQAHTTTLGSATNSDGTSGRAVSTIAPTMNHSGKVAVGTRLACTDGTWANDPTSYRIRWRRVNRLLHTGATYTVTRADAGYRIRCFVTAYNPQGSSYAALGGTVTVKGIRAATRK
jgi:hypothetical protein